MVAAAEGVVRRGAASADPTTREPAALAGPTAMAASGGRSGDAYAPDLGGRAWAPSGGAIAAR